MLYLIGTGLFDEKDLTLRGLEALKQADYVYAEFYTSPFNGRIEDLEALCGKKITLLSRKELEEQAEENILADAREKMAALLVGGDPMVATTHSELVLDARKKGIEVKVVHSSSIFSAVAETGLQVYKFGKTISLPFPEEGYFPTSPYDSLKQNLEQGLHTLCLLDIRADEGRYMTVNQAIRLLLEMAEKKGDRSFNEETRCVGVARLGGDSRIVYGSAAELVGIDFGGKPHALIVPGKLHFMEEEMLESFAHP